MARVNPLYVLIYFIADLGSLAWLLYAFTDELPHAMLGLSDGAGTIIYAVIGVIAILSVGATVQKLAT
jgi:uncharacterized membrane protein YuzA (DUF378 family)